MSETARALESLLGFWIDAGVDAALTDAPIDRTADRVPAPSPVTPQPAAAPIGDILRAPPARDTSAVVAGAKALAAAAETLEALEAAIAAFDGCPLKSGARRTVFARGTPGAPVLIVGEAPGGDEDAQGLPFVGRAGQLLDRMLAAAGLEGRVFITNTVFWRPPGNRTPTAEEQAVCAPFVERAIVLNRPRALFFMGAAAAKFMLARPEGILSLRGRWFEWRSDDETVEIPALPTLHPAFLLRQPGAKKKSWTDLQMLAERVDRPERPDAS